MGPDYLHHMPTRNSYFPPTCHRSQSKDSVEIHSNTHQNNNVMSEEGGVAYTGTNLCRQPVIPSGSTKGIVVDTRRQ